MAPYWVQDGAVVQLDSRMLMKYIVQLLGESVQAGIFVSAVFQL